MKRERFMKSGKIRNKDKKKGNFRSEKGKMFLQHCYKHPKDVLRLGKATILYGTEGLKGRADELARKEWKKQHKGRGIGADKLSCNIKFSIVMPVYNVEIKWLDKAIQSVKDQTYQNWEICIADDASTDISVRRYLESIRDERIKIKYL